MRETLAYMKKFIYKLNAENTTRGFLSNTDQKYPYELNVVEIKYE